MKSHAIKLITDPDIFIIMSVTDDNIPLCYPPPQYVTYCVLA